MGDDDEGTRDVGDNWCLNKAAGQKVVMRQMDAPPPSSALSQLTAELRKAYQKAGKPSYRDVVRDWPKAGEMSVATLTRLLKGQNVRFPRWKTVADFIQVCRETLARTGVGPDAEIGTIEAWHTRWKHLNDLHVGNVNEPPAAPGDDPYAQADSALSGNQAHDQVSYVPRHASDSRLCSTLDKILIQRWFGRRGTDLLDWAHRGQPLATFELGILLILRRGLLLDGSEFLRQAASLDPRLTLSIRLNPEDKLYGRIPSDICHRVGSGYAYEGLAEVAQQWHNYSRSLNGIPMIGILTPSGRHVVPADVLDLQPVRHSPLDPNEVLQIDTVYHEVYAWTPEPKEDHEILPMPLPPLADTEVTSSWPS
ncbi:hypothetical protein AB0L05_28930 [Nonomuraea pusilla]|uniref:hypothetical protein n=1 Tax=Nonomuraea pusilla TaxID=46177 RepID=UPI00332BE1C6